MSKASKFMESHKEVHTPITQDGKPFLEVSCEKCDWKHTMRLNSGINIGMRLALTKHMEFWESTRKKYSRVCPQCNKESGTREIIWGMPAGIPDESKYYIGGCTSEDFSVKYKCIECGWEGKRLKRVAI
mgnify:CR=1 FL=1